MDPAQFVRKDPMIRVMSYLTVHELLPMQLVCRHLYDEKVPHAMTRLYFRKERKRVGQMLEEEPVFDKYTGHSGSGVPPIVANWRLIKRADIYEFEKYWQQFTRAPMFDFSVAEAKKWYIKYDLQKEKDGMGMTRYFGMRHKFTGKPHGICRTLTSGYLTEGTYVNGRPLGLVRIIGAKNIEMFVNGDKGPAAWIEFLPNFKQTSRVDKLGVLGTCTAVDFAADREAAEKLLGGQIPISKPVQKPQPQKKE